ncbi:type II toxin-antitoxin system VapC family toxin [Granulicella mallensis]|uniref:Ribonuclease VapC n=1 Tax=Granulicella mallensis TaxID=940614 RepID=A0A7W8E9M9_9BACT|nr:type II toxin-antitoxin system VapC family toxin [Granulicella mallensis]MBB5064623.1 hypothetical protein [Granulicella mallensis]
MYLLDTNCISELRKIRPHGAVLSWFNAQSLDTLALPSVTIYELHSGAQRTRRQNPAKADEIAAWIESVIRSIVVLPFGTAEAHMAADFMDRKSVDLLPDAMIAATAAIYDLTLVTRNTRDFLSFPVRLLNPFIT